MNKVLVAIGVGAVAVSLNVNKSYADSNATVNVSALNIRSGPGINYSKKGVVYKGASLNIIETNGEWSHVTLDNGEKGWVCSKYINSTSSSNNIANNVSGQVSVTASYVNIRTGAGTNNTIKTVVPYGTKLTLISKSNGWYNVKLENGTTGWISGKYISTISNNQNSNQSSNTYNNFTPCNGKVTSYANLNVRSGPGTNYTIKTRLIYGQVVKLTEKINGWYKITLSNGSDGWVHSDYIKITTEAVSKPSGTTLNNSNTSSNNSNRSAVVNLAYSLLGKPYVWGANGPNSFDCSGFTRYVYLHAEGKSIPRVSYEQAKK